MTQPTRDLVVIKRQKPRRETKAGVLLPEEPEKGGTTGVVQACGPKCKNAASMLGKRVLFTPYREKELPDGAVIIKEEHILGVFQ